jgi:hypothetical protein
MERPAMDPVPHWLEKTVFAAGMTAYAVEVDAKDSAEMSLQSPAAEAENQDSYH